MPKLHKYLSTLYFLKISKSAYITPSVANSTSKVCGNFCELHRNNLILLFGLFRMEECYNQREQCSKLTISIKLVNVTHQTSPLFNEIILFGNHPKDTDPHNLIGRNIKAANGHSLFQWVSHYIFVHIYRFQILFHPYNNTILSTRIYCVLSFFKQ